MEVENRDKKECRYFPTHAFVGAVICKGHVFCGQVIVNQCKYVENCLTRLYKDSPEILKRKLKEVRRIKSRIHSIDTHEKL